MRVASVLFVFFAFQSHPYVISANVLFGSLAIFHLAYLGVMFDTSSNQETVCIAFKKPAETLYHYAAQRKI